MNAQAESWCKVDGHADYELFEDFNAWIDAGEINLELPLLRGLGNVGLSNPSKAFFAGDREAYEQALQAYRGQRRNEVLSRDHLIELYGDEDGQHWFERNEQRFEQLVECLAAQEMVPFVGAGVSAGGGFPTWANHLRQQGRTAGLAQPQVEAWLAQGDYESVIADIEQRHGRDVFAQEIRDVFGKRGRIQDITLLISELFTDTLVTTNYDRLLEQVYDTGDGSYIQVLDGTTAMTVVPDPKCVTLIKIHGDFADPAHCILGKAQYDAAYGAGTLDLQLPVPKILARFYRNNSLLFLGCNLRNDRTLQVFLATKLAAGDALLPRHFCIDQVPVQLADLTVRNAELARLGITAIWYPEKQYQFVDDILRLAKSELNYKKSQVARAKHFMPKAMREMAAMPDPAAA
ncbi:SIR2-like protein [Pseudacidovorax intermedius]|uniref:SIR2-like protein n=1 Tax=Pseudacidovorax intermedius TaxID=433924 RepID=A0A370FR95_9BURK|nr:SIR2 family protein [Pseudacidovorax intermedius]RDI28258.1 SIR2-like protein [Pseudacidovorax intermedius]